jgi:hypothetical protein
MIGAEHARFIRAEIWRKSEAADEYVLVALTNPIYFE